MVNPLDPNYFDKHIYTSDEEHPLIAPNKPFIIKGPKKTDALHNDKHKKNKKDKNGNDIEDEDDGEGEETPKPLPRPMGL